MIAICFNVDVCGSFVNYVAGGKVARHKRDGLELLKPFIAARRDQTNEEKTEKFVRRMRSVSRENSRSGQNDFVSWVIDESKGENKEDWTVVARVFNVNFASIHTSSMVSFARPYDINMDRFVVQAVTQALFDLASNPECMKPLREEVEEVTKREGWTKAALDQMVKVDSFVKESQRLHPAAVRELLYNVSIHNFHHFYFYFKVMIGRYAMADYTFSDGTFIPAGTIVGVSSNSVHRDPQTYEDPLRFDGFRFVKMKERAALDGYPHKIFDMVTTNANFVGFGQGRHACPGRFFAAAEIKLLFAYIVTTYDIKLVDDARPLDFFRLNGIMPDPAAKVYFRRRQ